MDQLPETALRRPCPAPKPASPQSLRSEIPPTPTSSRKSLKQWNPAAGRIPTSSVDEAEEWPGRPQSHPPAPPVQAPSTSRRGLIRVTTQRALGQPPPPEPSASSMASAPASSPPANATAPPLRWGPLRRVLSFSWELHVYGVGVLFLLPALLALAMLAAAPAGPRLALVAAVLVLVASGLRSAYMLTDPYGSQARLGVRAGLVLYNLPFPLLLTALAALSLLGLGAGLPQQLQNPLLLGALALVHCVGLLATLPRPLEDSQTHLILGAHPNGPSLFRGRCRSLSDVRVRGPVPPHVVDEPDAAAAAASGSSLDSFSRGSLKISWNPWRHGLSSVDSLPLDELPSTVQLLPAPTPAPAHVRPGDPQGEVQPRCKPGDSRSASSDTIEL
ncbi:PREDICTED: proline-rich transmembrane protein 3 [Galeopterus variegatus]|uniref:Proline-rich transmembrane protein 3 n=1 Tax=Galeopterus variegatus TaxID=482537 RepID=A0ABM0R529_GALVR|nr:PREDICTED: proline-rich transmembrane protein 3 [Galeopterus variegatus]